MDHRDINTILKINNYIVSLDLDKKNNNEEKKRLAKKNLDKKLSQILNRKTN